ncbi:TetR/AcrR family transcriptional regulator [Gammaproteobacteria bacterium]|nr:TetR/AcrR family transcriptional regulator [Gammaproteobacteria bacterium]
MELIAKQERSKKRVKLILQTAESILLRDGLEAITIANIAKYSGLKRTSTYKFFPTTDSLKAMMIKGYFKDCENVFREELTPLETNQVSVIVLKTVEVMYKFFRSSKAAQLIILKNTVSPPMSSESMHSLASSIEYFIDNNIELPGMYNKSGVYRVLTQLILSVFALNAKENGELNEVGRIEAHRAGLSYLLNWINQSS